MPNELAILPTIRVSFLANLALTNVEHNNKMCPQTKQKKPARTGEIISFRTPIKPLYLSSDRKKVDEG